MRRHNSSCVPPTRFSHGLGPNPKFAAVQRRVSYRGEADGRRLDRLKSLIALEDTSSSAVKRPPKVAALS
jgi:hypothetical protein